MWTIEPLQRADKVILIIKKDDEVKGNITCEDQGDVDFWYKILSRLNDPTS